MAENIEVLLNNDDITVLGPPEIVELSVDIGAKGFRGSQFFVGVGNPNIINIGQTPALNDMYINAAPGSDYAYMYQYVSQPGGNTWIEVLKINPTIYSENHEATFVAGSGAYSGSGSIVIPISNIINVTGSPLVAENFNVQYQIVNSNPVASSMTIPELTTDDLVIDIEATEYVSGSWQPLEGNIVIHVFISIVYIS
jgi:hypothetical protein